MAKTGKQGRMKLFIIHFLTFLIYPLAVVGFVLLTVKNHPFMAILLLYAVFQTSFNVNIKEDKGANQ